MMIQNTIQSCLHQHLYKDIKLKILYIAVIVFSSISILFISNLSADEQNTPKSIFDFTMNDIDGNPVKLEIFKGKVILLVNVASKCAYTPQYKGLQKIYSKYKDKNFVILGFPANNFLWQEPGNNARIKSFCSLKYGVEFPMFSKISVKGRKQHPLYKFLTSKLTNPLFPGKIRWNFEKFVFNSEGKLVGRFHPKIKPEDKRIIELLEKEINSGAKTL